MNLNIKNKIIIILSILLTLIVLYLILYVWSGLGYRNDSLNLPSSAPFWFESIVVMLFIPALVGVNLVDKLKK